MNVTDLLRSGDLAIDLAVPNKALLMTCLARRAGAATGLSEAAILAALQAREMLGSTGIGNGIAIPHASVSGLAEPFGHFVRLAQPLDFNSIDGSLVDLVFLVLLPQQNCQSDLNALSCVARQLRSGEIQSALRAAVDTDTAYFALAARAL